MEGIIEGGDLRPSNAGGIQKAAEGEALGKGHGMNGKTHSILRALCIVTLLSGALLSVLWTVLLLLAREGVYFASGSPLPILFYAFLGVILAGFVAFGVFLGRMAPVPLEEGNAPLFFSTATAGLCALVYGVVLFLCRVSLGGMSAVPFLFAALFAFALAAALLLRLLPGGLLPDKARKTAETLCLFGGVLFALCYAVGCYFSTDVPTNSPFTWTDQLFFLALALFLLADAGVKLGQRRIGLLFAASGPVFALGVSLGLGNLVSAAVSGGAPLRDSVMHDFFLLAMGLYAFLRQWQAVREVCRPRSRLLDAIAARAAEEASEARRQETEDLGQETARRPEEERTLFDGDTVVFDIPKSEDEETDR